jgi:hypothetical protein
VDGDDALLETLIESAQAIIDAHTHRTFEATADEARAFDFDLDTDGSRILYLDEDLCSVTGIALESGTAITSYVTQPRNRTPYYAIRIKKEADDYWEYTTDPEDVATITGRWAYSVAAPDAIVHACIRLTAWLYRQRDTGGDADRVQRSELGTLLMPGALPADVVQFLKPYVRL